MEAKEQSLPVIAITAAVGAVLLLVFLVFNAFKSEKKDNQDENGDVTQGSKKTKSNGSKKGNSKKGNQAAKNKRSTAASLPFSHPWLAGTLKGHASSVVSFDFSTNGKYLVSSSEDRVVMLWSVKEFCQKDHKYIRGNVTYDSVSHIAFSPDSKAFIGWLENENAIRVFRMAKKEDGSNTMAISEGQTFPVKQSSEVIAMEIASNGRFLMTCGADTMINLWTPKGEHLATINTNQVQNSCGRISTCGRFVGSSGFTTDVKIWEICFDKSNAFKEVKRAFELKGHNAGVYSFDFSNDSTRMASVSKDGTWKLWNTDVNYQMDQDAKLLFTGSVSLPGPLQIALSPDGLTAAIASDSTIGLYDASSDSPDIVFENVHSEPITCLAFDPLNRYVVSSGGRHLQVIHNVTGLKALLRDLEAKLKAAKSKSLEERLKKQIEDKRAVLEGILSGGQQTEVKAR